MIIQAVRSAVFYALYLGQTTILAIIVGTVGLVVRGWSPFSWAIAKYWAKSNMVFLRWVVGIKSEITGMENIPPGGCIIASKHQSDWDILTLVPHTGRPAFIAKKQLMDIPFFGWAARSLDTISIDRSKGAEAIPEMTESAKQAVARGCRIIIFPEGTRKAPLADPAYRTGVARLYKALNVPVVPVALNSGLFWGRNALILWPGTAKAKFLEPIPPGLPIEEMQQLMRDRIEAATNDLIAEAAEKGLSRPITPQMRSRLDALVQARK